MLFQKIHNMASTAARHGIEAGFPLETGPSLKPVIVAPAPYALQVSSLKLIHRQRLSNVVQISLATLRTSMENHRLVATSISGTRRIIAEMQTAVTVIRWSKFKSRITRLVGSTKFGIPIRERNI